MAASSRIRSSGADIVRCFALFCVVSVHFFLHTGFYYHEISGTRMFLMTSMRSFFMICVPLFMTLSGYLMCNKRPEKAYFFKITKTLVIYLLASIVCVAFRILYWDPDYSIKEGIIQLLAFEAAPYGWYVEMYIGLFLVCPFLNLIWQGLQARKQKQLLLLVFLFLTAAPSLVNVYHLTNPGFWRQPSSSDYYTQLIPEYWEDLYPLTYYFLGCYLREYPLKLKKSHHLLWIVFSFFAIGLYNVYRSWGADFVTGPWSDHGSLLTFIQTLLVFDFLVRLDFPPLCPGIKKCLATASDLCFGAYLVSWIFDMLLYKALTDHVTDVPRLLEYYFLIVPVVYILSLSLSGVLQIVYRFYDRHLEKPLLKRFFP